jgi:hypothetical protein
MISHRGVQGLALHPEDQPVRKQIKQDLGILENCVTQFIAITKKITNFASRSMIHSNNTDYKKRQRRRLGCSSLKA